MALIECIECQGRVSEHARACPHCGCPRQGAAAPPPAPQPTRPPAPTVPSFETPLPGAILRFTDFADLRRQLRLGKVHAAAACTILEEPKLDLRPVLVVVGTPFAFLALLAAVPEDARMGVTLIAGVIVVGALIAAVIRLTLRLARRPFTLVIVDDEAISFLAETWFLLGRGEARLAERLSFTEIGRVTYRTSFWRKWLTLELDDGKFLHMRQKLLIRRRTIPGVEMKPLRSVGAVLARLGLELRFSYWAAMFWTALVTASGLVGIVGTLTDIAGPRRGSGPDPVTAPTATAEAPSSWLIGRWTGIGGSCDVGQSIEIRADGTFMSAGSGGSWRLVDDVLHVDSIPSAGQPSPPAQRIRVERLGDTAMRMTFDNGYSFVVPRC